MVSNQWIFATKDLNGKTKITAKLITPPCRYSDEAEKATVLREKDFLESQLYDAQKWIEEVCANEFGTRS